MEVVVTSRRCQLTDAFRDHVSEKLNSLEKLKERIIRAEVMVTLSDAKRQPEQAVRVEITLNGKGPVVRAEASADDKMVAFEHALDRLKTQLLRASDRRKTHRGLRGAPSLKVADAVLETLRRSKRPTYARWPGWTCRATVLSLSARRTSREHL